jgi:hypothetical protein
MPSRPEFERLPRGERWRGGGDFDGALGLTKKVGCQCRVPCLANVDAIVKRHFILIVRAVRRGAFKGAALIGAFVVILAAWWWDASLLTVAADKNLELIKMVTGALPFDWGSKAESALRIFGADRALLLIESVAIAKVVMLSVAFPFRRRHQPTR